MRIVTPLVAALVLALPTVAVAQQAPPRISERALDTSSGDAVPEDWRQASPVVAKQAMVVSAQHLATDVGVSILKRGGNAVDAAVAVGYALAVVHPCCGNIGGGGFMTVHLADGRNLFLDFREKAPLKATATLFQDEDGNVVPGRSTGSYLGVGVPGTVMGLNEALKRYGTMPLGTVMAPAIALAAKGYVLQPGDVAILGNRTADFATEPNVAAIFLNHGRPFVAGERLVQSQLAATLRTIARGGTNAFYRGKPAAAIAAASAANGGLLSREDFARYTVQWDTPVSCTYRGHLVVSAPPPSSGGTTLCEILKTIEAYPLASWGYGSVPATHHLIEAERRAYADRNTALGDPAFVDNPVAQLISDEHTAQLRRSIHADRATPSAQIKGGIAASPEGTNTTHYSVLDRQGNAVSVTFTINYLFGVGKIAGNTGFFLNNEMDDFTSKPGVPNGFGLVQGDANAIAPGKRPLSSMAPTILLKNGKPYMLTGSPGGSTIITTVLQSIVNVVDFGMTVQHAVNAPRFHHQWLPDQVMVEPGYLDAASRQRLEEMGHSFTETPGWGADEAILADPASTTIQGANDRRRPAGKAGGY